MVFDMKITMNDSRIDSIAQLREFVNSSPLMELGLDTIEQKYQFINKTVKKFKYSKLSKRDKNIVRLYLKKVTHYKKAQLNRLITRAVNGELVKKAI